MRNIVVLRDQIYKLIGGEATDVSISALSFDKSGSRAFVLLSTGDLVCFTDVDDNLSFASKVSCCTEEGDVDRGWFELSFIAGTGSVVAISHSGSIVAVDSTTPYDLAAEQIGCIDGGIASAKWSPDQSSLTIVTNNDTILCMSSTWDVLQEIPIPGRVPASLADISWRGDGEGVAVVTMDAEDQTARVRMYNKQLELVSTGRNVADGPASVMKGLGGAVAFATNGSYIAVSQEQRTGSGGTRLQVALVERNGLRHGDFDVHAPPVPQGWERWEVASLHWDLPTSLLAVGLRAAGAIDSAAAGDGPGVLQLYYRGNYHWYLKQQWRGPALRFLGFDEEQANRMYLTQSVHSGSSGAAAALRVVDIAWDVCSSGTADSAVAVTDGHRVLFTPLGINNIPPPMCKHAAVLTPPSASGAAEGGCCPRSSCFWSVTPRGDTGEAAAVWGYAALCTDSDGTSVFLAWGDKVGTIVAQQWVELGAVGCDPALSSAIRAYNLRGITVTQSGDLVRMVLLGSAALDLPTEQGVTGGVPGGDLLVVLEVAVPAEAAVQLSASHVSVKVIPLPDGAATRVFSVPHDPDSVGVGVVPVYNDGSDFEVYRVPIAGGGGPARLVHTLPEQCSHLAYIAPHHENTAVAGCPEDEGAVVMALSLRNRLYCGESLVSAGVSSFVYNESFGMLMFATLGTRPHLHFCSIQRLLALDALQHSEDQESAECAEPRPIERGARLVVSAAGSSRVVLQLPRGNLETIEPRPLILLRAQQLLHSARLLDCLVLLRKQRVDLNYLVDYSPRIFFDNVQSFVADMLRTSHDLISLLVTALDSIDVTLYKYPLDKNCLALQEPREVSNCVGAEKVNRVCRAVRNALLPLLQAARSAVPANDVTASRVLQPVLCTLAKQQPAQLEAALDLIRLCCTSGGMLTTVTTGTDADPALTLHVVGGTANLSSVMAQVSIKYLAFLVEGSQLFDAALGSCDFDMARAVARQCQMDPRAYLPLVEGFEVIARGFDSAAPQFSLMRFRVNVHLKRHTHALDAAVQFLGRVRRFGASNDASETLYQEAVSAVTALKGIVKAEGLHSYVLPRLAGLLEELGTDPATAVLVGADASISARMDAVIAALLSDLRLEHGQLCAGRMEYAEAVAAILATHPVRAVEAIEVAKQMGNWQLAISIAGRYHAEERYKGVAEVNPVHVAQQIVSEFRENMEQAEAFGNLRGGGDTGNVGGSEGGDTDGAGSGDQSGAAAEDKVAEAARLCVEYCDDHEAAIVILTTAQRWLPALQLAMRYQRRDLFSEIAGAARAFAEEVVATLPRRAAKVTALVDELATLWADPALRLQNVASTDVTLMDELNGVDAAQQRQLDDSLSVYSAATQQSTFSRSSARSDGSRYSTKSGSSVVSVLSNLSVASGLSEAGGDRAGKGSSFSIEGLEHTLLSRGTVTARGGEDGPDISGVGGKDAKRMKKQYKRDQTERRQKRIERSKAKGASKDVWGLRREAAVCEELVGHARQLRQVARACGELCRALQLINEKGDLALAIALQRAVDDYMGFVQQHPPCVAPNYPPEWLVKRALAAVRHFQDPSSLAASQAAQHQEQGVQGAGVFGELASHGGEAARKAQVRVNAVTPWWDIAAAGLKEWYATSRLALTSQPLTGL